MTTDSGNIGKVKGWQARAGSTVRKIMECLIARHKKQSTNTTDKKCCEYGTELLPVSGASISLNKSEVGTKQVSLQLIVYEQL